MIIIFSDPEDEHAKVVAKKIFDNHNERPVILDLSRFAQNALVKEHLTNSHATLKIDFPNNKSIDLHDVTGFWWRRPQPIRPDPSIRKPSHIQFVLNEWNSALNGIWSCTDCLWINDISNDEKADKKSYQLIVAQRVGLTVPETLITNNPSEITDFWKKYQGKIIFKSFLATYDEWRETRLLEQEFLKLINTVRYAPVIFQEYVDSAKDLRITIIGKQVFAAETVPNESYQYDWRMSKSSWKVHQLPAEIEAKLLNLMKTLGLEYGAIDMRLQNNTYYFLEVNPAGQFLFVEYDANLPLSDALAKHLFDGKKTWAH